MPKRKESLSELTFRIMQNAKLGDDSSRFFDYALSGLIIVNTITVMLETVPELMNQYGTWLLAADTFFALFFTAEYLLRLWSVTSTRKYSAPFMGRLRFALTPLVLIDLLAILPFFLPLFLPFNLNVLRAIRLLRLIRILKIYRYSDALQAFFRVIVLKKRLLAASLLILAIGLVFSSTIIYYAEHAAQPHAFGSIPSSLWWATITLSTVGYGDVVPITPLGRLFGALVALMGIGIFAIPAGILASGFTRVSVQLARQKELAKRKRRR
jgi:voltage-gated potassium channel